MVSIIYLIEALRTKVVFVECYDLTNGQNAATMVGQFA